MSKRAACSQDEQMKAAKPEPCECVICADRLDFDLDAHLLREIERRNCVLFAGAGISTEGTHAHCNTFYEEVAAEVGAEGDLPFPELMERLEKEPNGRQKLVQKIVDRFHYIDSFRDLWNVATRFHRELATMPYFDEIVSTNWDRYFETYAGAVPFVYDSDIAFWGLARRSVLKIHGSIDNYASLIATTEDYRACEERLRVGTLGAVLKQIFATKTCIFVGYSVSDRDFLQLYETLQKSLGPFKRTHYLVAPRISDEQAARLIDLSIRPIPTDGTFFLEVIKQHMCDKCCYARDEAYTFADAALGVLWKLHKKFTDEIDIRAAPHLLCSVFYQDGLIHALERIIDARKSGEYSDLHRVQKLLRGYEQKIASYKRARNYTEVSYFRGYANGLVFFLISNDELKAGDPSEDSIGDLLPPPFYHPGYEELSPEQFFEEVLQNPDSHKAARRHCERLVRSINPAEAIVLQHTPFG